MKIGDLVTSSLAATTLFAPHASSSSLSVPTQSPDLSDAHCSQHDCSLLSAQGDVRTDVDRDTVPDSQPRWKRNPHSGGGGTGGSGRSGGRSGGSSGGDNDVDGEEEGEEAGGNSTSMATSFGGPGLGAILLAALSAAIA
jgi:hypothetical protein